jgi:hypothetical protein
MIQDRLAKVAHEFFNQTLYLLIHFKWSRDPPEEIVLVDLVCSQPMVGIDFWVELECETGQVFVLFFVCHLGVKV